MPQKWTRGLSLLEVLTTMAVSAVVLGFAIPGMGNLIKENRLSTHVNTLYHNLSLTRSVAVEKNVTAILCKSSDGENCTSDSDWNQGWIVFIDEDNDRTLSDKEKPILAQKALPEHTQVTLRAFGSRNYIAYRPSGLTRTNGTFVICTPDNQNRAKTLILNKSGRIRQSDLMPGGKKIRCEKKPE